MSNPLNRRDFLKNLGIATAGLSAIGNMSAFGQAAAAPAVAASSPAGANNKLVVAVVGTNSRGLNHIQCLDGYPDIEVAYVCDVDDRAIAKGLKASKKQATPPKGIKDFRKILEDKSVDAITIATPDHWHAPMAMMALAAGKHLYLEKPCSHNPFEGELLVEAVTKHKRVLQMGNQRRSFPNMNKAVGEIHEGIIGKVYFGRAWYVNKRATIGTGKEVPVPEWLDYELWQGPAPRKPFRDNLVPYNWHWFWNWGTGEALNNGTHEVDICRWAMGLELPTRVVSNGGRYYFKDDWETPDTQTIGWDFALGKSITWEGRSCNDFPIEGLSRGVMVYGTDGAILLDGNAYTQFDKKHKVVKEVKGNSAVDRTDTASSTGASLDLLHFKDFFEAIRTGKKPNSPIEEGHKSVLLLQLGNIAFRTGRELHCDPANGHIKDDADAMKLWRREYEPGWEPKI